MPNKHSYERGRRAEYRAIDILRAEGYHALRSPQSRGVYDIHAFKHGHHRFIQVKSYQDYHNPETMAANTKQAFDKAGLPFGPNDDRELWIQTAKGFLRYQLHPEITLLDSAPIERRKP